MRTAPRPIQRQIQAHLTWLKQQLAMLGEDLTHRIQATRSGVRMRICCVACWISGPS
jgi:hypothetical protein